MWIADTDRAGVLCFAFSPDGSTIYTGDDEGAVFAWDRASQEGREVFRLPKAVDGTASLWQVVPKPCGARLLVPSNGAVFVVDPSGATKARKLKAALTDRGTRVGLSADGGHFLSATPQNRPACWDAETGLRVALPGALGKSAECLAAEYLPGGRAVLTVGHSPRSLVLWDAATGDELGACSPGNAGSLPRATSADGAAVAVAGPVDQRNRVSNQVWVYDLAARVRRVALDTKLKPDGIAFHPSAPVLATVDGTRGVKTWNAVTGEPRETFFPKIGNVSAVAYSPDGTIWCAGGVGRFAVFDVDD